MKKKIIIALIISIIVLTIPLTYAIWNINIQNEATITKTQYNLYLKKNYNNNEIIDTYSNLDYNSSVILNKQNNDGKKYFYGWSFDGENIIENSSTQFTFTVSDYLLNNPQHEGTNIIIYAIYKEDVPEGYARIDVYYGNDIFSNSYFINIDETDKFYLWNLSEPDQEVKLSYTIKNDNYLIHRNNEDYVKDLELNDYLSFSDNVLIKVGSNYKDISDINNIIELKINSFTYYISFVRNGGSGSINSLELVYGAEFDLPSNTFTKEGYHFLHWNTNPGDYGDNIFSNQAHITNSLTKIPNTTVYLYVIWEPNTYYVSFNSNGGTGTMANQQLTYDLNSNLNSSMFLKTGYSFSAWNVETNGSGTSFSQNSSVINLTAIENGIVNLYAQWTPKTYNIQVSGSEHIIILKYDSTDVDLGNEVHLKNGYDFDGFALNSENGITLIDKDGHLVKNITGFTNNDGEFIHDGTFMLYTKWKIINYHISYNLNGGILANNNPENYTIETTTFTLNNPTKVGYTFVGWIGTGLTGEIMSVSINQHSTGDKSFTANFTPNDYLLDGNINHGTITWYGDINHSIEITSASYDSTIYYVITPDAGYEIENGQGSIILNSTNFTINNNIATHIFDDCTLSE